MYVCVLFWPTCDVSLSSVSTLNAQFFFVTVIVQTKKPRGFPPSLPGLAKPNKQKPQKRVEDNTRNKREKPSTWLLTHS